MFDGLCNTNYKFCIKYCAGITIFGVMEANRLKILILLISAKVKVKTNVYMMTFEDKIFLLVVANNNKYVNVVFRLNWTTRRTSGSAPICLTLCMHIMLINYDPSKNQSIFFSVIECGRMLERRLMKPLTQT